MALLTADAILAAQDRPHEDVSVPEWGGEVRVATMSGKDRDEFEAESYEAGKSGTQLVNIRARLVARCLVDENGSRLFSLKQIEALGAKSAAALDRIYAVATRLNGMTEADIEDLEKNS